MSAYALTEQENLVYRERADGVGEDLIRRVWHLADDLPVQGFGYEITEDNVRDVQPFITRRIELGAFTWQLSDEDEEDGSVGHAPLP